MAGAGVRNRRAIGVGFERHTLGVPRVRRTRGDTAHPRPQGENMNSSHFRQRLLARRAEIE
ncbi:MAG: hypothetical protein RLW42_18190, partial [Gammaproteobacteria bacterium]